MTAPLVLLKLLMVVTTWVMGGTGAVKDFHRNQLCVHHMFLIVAPVFAHNLQCKKYLIKVR